MTMPGSKASSSPSPLMQASLVRLQIEELLDEQTPSHEARARKVQGLLKDIQQTLRSLPSREPLLYPDLQDVATKHLTATIPFPTTRPSVDSRHRFGFCPPTQFELVGGFALETTIRHDQSSCIDLAVIMPIQLLEEKDYLDYRYIHKRAYYLACLAEGLKANLDRSVDLSYSYRDDNELQPCIIVVPQDSNGQSRQQWSRVRILIGPPPNAFNKERLRPWLSCLRDRMSDATKGLETNRAPTPLYNGVIISECSFESYHTLLSESSRRVPNFKSACKLMKIWLHQRGFATGVKSGGFGSFESSCCLALLLRGSSRPPISLLSKESDSFHLFSSLLQLLAHRDLVREPLVLGKVTEKLPDLNLQSPLLYDAERQHNVLFKMSIASYQSLKAVAVTALKALSQLEPVRFYPTFIARTDGVFAQYDYIFHGTLVSQPIKLLQKINIIYEILTTALRDRSLRVDLRHTAGHGVFQWACSLSAPPIDTSHEILLGIVANPTQVARRVDLGPAAEDTDGARDFRKFWGEKADLRRFANGEIRECVTWPTPDNDGDILDAIITYVVRRHFPDGTVNFSSVLGPDFSRLMYPHMTTPQAQHLFERPEEAFKQLQDCVWRASGHPLKLRQISGSGAGLRYASVKAEEMRGSVQSYQGCDIVIQFEGSMRWPEDIFAIQHTKVALLSKMGEMLKGETGISSARLGLENTAPSLLNRAFLDVTIGVTVFRLRIYHDREAPLLERIIKDKSLHVRERERAIGALFAHKRTFVHSTKHTQAIRELCAKIPLLSPAMRILKLWVSSHLLSSHFSEELFELIVVHIFIFSYPDSPPGSLRSAFLRSLAFIAKWDWQNEPLVVNFGSAALTGGDLDAILTKFHEWRKVDPAMHRMTLFAASNIEPDGTAWTSPRPIVVAVNRLIALAGAVVKEVTREGLNIKEEVVFSRSLKDFDFIIHLRQRRPSESTSATSEQQTDAAMWGYAIREFTEELERAFSGIIVFFHDREAQPVIGGLWLPQEDTREWSVSSSWGTIPTTYPNGKHLCTTLSKVGILQQIAVLGGEMISRITRHDLD